MKHLFHLLFFISFSCFAQIPKYTVSVTDSNAKGYYFLSPRGCMLLLDGKGEVVCYNPGKIRLNVFLLSNGLITTFEQNRFYFLDSTFRVIDSVTCSANYETDPRAICILPNHHFLLIGSEKIKMDLSKFSWKNSFGSDTATVRCGIIQELDEKKEVVFEWHAKDHFAFDDVDTFYLKPDPVNVDWNHFNSLCMDTDGNIIVGSRNFNEMTKISRTDGSIIWRWGGKRNQFKTYADALPFYGAHDVRRIDNGNITLFDGGNNISGHGARGLEYSLDEKNKTATLKWSYTFNPKMKSIDRGGNVQRIENGNTLINYGHVTGDNVCFVVVNSQGDKLFQLTFNDTLNPFVTHFHSSIPWKVKRPLLTCFDSLGKKYIKTKESYSSYQWSDSSSTRMIAVTKPGVYSVFVPYGENGFIRSENFVATDIKSASKKKKKSKGK